MNSRWVIVINGPGGSGKDSFVKFCRRLLKKSKIKVYNISSIDPVKRTARKMGWDGTKDKRSRKFLADLKFLWIIFNDGPTEYLAKEIGQIQIGVIFLHIREPEEIAKIVSRVPNIVTLHLTRNGLETIGNSSDDETGNFDYSHHIQNDGSLEDLEERARRFLEELGII